MTHLGYVYALLAALCEEGQDYLDAFWPFAIQVFPPSGRISTASVQQKLSTERKISAPIHVLELVLRRARRKGYVERGSKPNTYKLTPGGLNYLDTLEAPAEVERRMNALAVDAQAFLEDRGAAFTSEQVLTLLVHIFEQHNEALMEFVSASRPETEYGETIQASKAQERLLIEYIQQVERQSPSIYRTLQDMLLGSVICKILYSEDPSTVTRMATKKFKRCQAFLDTNLAVAVLGLGFSEFTDPAAELLQLMQAAGFRTKVFSFTVTELVILLSNYIRSLHWYSPAIRVNDLYSSLRIKGWTATRTKEFISNIEAHLESKGIEIEATAEVSLEDYVPKDKRINAVLQRYKPDQGIVSRNHDIAAIECIKVLRRRPIRKLENAQAIFLTSDGHLSKANFDKMGHRENRTVCEVIQDRLLTSILWLKAPSTKPSLKTIIATLSRDLFIKKRVWTRFYNILVQLRSEDKLKDKEIVTLFYQDYITGVLENIEEDQAEVITERFVLDEVVEAVKVKDEVSKKEQEEKQEELSRLLEQQLRKKEEEVDQKWIDALEESKRALMTYAAGRASCYARLIAGFLVICMLGISSIIWLLAQELSTLLALLIAILALLPVGGGLTLAWRRLRATFERWAAKNILSKEMRKTRLPNVQQQGQQ